MAQVLGEQCAFWREVGLASIEELLKQYLMVELHHLDRTDHLRTKLEAKIKGMQQYKTLQGWKAVNFAVWALQDSLAQEQQRTQTLVDKIEGECIDVVRLLRIGLLDKQQCLVDVAKQQTGQYTRTITKLTASLSETRKNINQLQFECFKDILVIGEQMDQDIIAKKCKGQITAQQMTYLGRKRSLINDSLDQITQLEGTIPSVVNKLKETEVERNSFLEKVRKVFNSIEVKKQKKILELGKILGFEDEVPAVQINRKFKETTGVDLESIRKKASLQHIRKARHVLLTPQDKEEVILEHRKSIESHLAMSIGEEQGQYLESSTQSAPYHRQIDFFGQSRQLPVEGPDYQDYFDQLRGVLRNKRGRDGFLLWIRGTTEVQRGLGEAAILEDMIGMFLDKCSACFDGQNALRLLILSYSLKLPVTHDQLSLLTHQNWESLDFWLCAFLQSVYEYYEVVVLYYNKLLEQPQTNSAISRKHGWLGRLFNWWSQPEEEAKSPPRSSQFYQQIVSTVMIILLCNMRLLKLSEKLISQFTQNVIQASQGLKEHTGLIEKLKRCATIVLKRDSEQLMSLLKDKFIQSRIMSKLIGTGDEEEGSEVSARVSEWIGKAQQ